MYSLKHFLWVCGLASLWAWDAFSAPFNRDFTFRQADGGSVTIHGQGDEFYAEFFHKGFPVLLNHKTKNYEYAILKDDKSGFETSGIAVGSVNPETIPGLKKHARVSAEARKKIIESRKCELDPFGRQNLRWKQLKERRFQRKRNSGQIGVLDVGPYPETVGSVRGLTILVDFPDEPGTIPVEDVRAFLNGDGYTGYGNHGSVKEYFADVSNRKLDYQNELIAYVRAPHNKSTYDDPDIRDGSAACRLLSDVAEVLKKSENYQTQIVPMFNELSKGEDGCLLALNIFYAGTRGSEWGTGLWPCCLTLPLPSRNFFPELTIVRFMITDMGNDLAIGTFCHENGHMVCRYPDLYDYDNDSVGGAGCFCLMGAGNHLGGGKEPCQICAFLKYASGWVDVIEVDRTSFVEEAALTANPEAENFNSVYFFQKPDESNEFFLVENRNQSWRDKFIPASGLAVWHVDLDGDRDDQRHEFNNNHENYECCLMQADGLWDFNNNKNLGDQNDLFHAGNSAEGYANLFTESTNPSSRWWDGSISGFQIGNISPAGIDMTFMIFPSEPQFLSSKLVKGRVGTPYKCQVYGQGQISLPEDAALPDGITFADGLFSGIPTAAYSNELTFVTSCCNGKLAVTNSLTLEILPVYSLPFEERFTHADPDQGWGWTQDNVTNSVLWRYVNGNSFEENDKNRKFPDRAYSEPANAMFKISDPKLNGISQKLISPLMQFKEMPHAAQLTFYLYMKENVNSLDSLKVYYKTAWNAEWVFLEQIDTSKGDWVKYSFDLPELSRTYYFALEGTGNCGYGVHVDNVWFGDPTPSLKIEDTSLPQIVVDVPYVFTNQCAGGISPYTFTLSDGTLPAGIRYEDGVFSGTATAEAIGKYPIEISVRDSVGTKATLPFELEVNYSRVVLFEESFETTLAIFPPKGWTQVHEEGKVWWQSQSSDDDTLNQYPYIVPPKDGDFHAVFFHRDSRSGDEERIYPPLTTKLISPVLPIGYVKDQPRLTFWLHNRAYGIHQDELRVYYRGVASEEWNLLGTYTNSVEEWTQKTVELPNPTQTYQIAFEGTSRRGNGVHIDGLSISDVSRAPVLLNPPVFPDASQGLPYEYQLNASGGAGSNQWSVAGLPNGLTIDPGTGLISGIPGPGSKGPHDLALAITDKDGNTREFQVTLRVVGGRAIPFSENFDHGSFPAGWIVSTNNNVSWQVTKGGVVKDCPAAAYSPDWNLSCAAPGIPANTGPTCYLEMPMISFPNGCSNAVLTFKMTNFERGKDSCKYRDNLKIRYRTTTTNEWIGLKTFKSATSEWTTVSIELPNPCETYFISFGAYLKSGNGISVDDVRVTAEGGDPAGNLPSWIEKYYPEGAYPGDEIDSDGDGVPNILEFVYGTNPTNSADVGCLVPSVDDNIFTGTYRTSKAALEDGFILQPEICTNLVEGVWMPDCVTDAEGSPVDQGSWWLVIKKSDFLTTERSMQFMRLRLVYPGE